MKKILLLLAALATLWPLGCIKVKHEMSIQPVHVTVEIRVKIDKELENFFDDIDKASPAAKEKESTNKEEKDEK